MSRLIPPDVALIGRASTGKSTAGEYLTEKYGHEVLNFADPLRDLAEFLNPLVTPVGWRYKDVVSALGYRTAKDEVPEFRHVLDRLGRGAREIIGPDVWVDLLDSRVQDLDADVPVVVTDVRFPNEVARLKENGFVTVRLRRTDAPTVDAPSESAIDHVETDFTFANDASLDALHGFLDGIVLSCPRTVI